MRAALVSERRIIKKYPNRRLYDTVLSRYITLDDVKTLVQDRIPIQVIDTQTKKDLTHTTLLYLIIDQESKGMPVLNNKLLEQMIRLYAYFSDTQDERAVGIYQLVTDSFARTVDFLAEQLCQLEINKQEVTLE